MEQRDGEYVAGESAWSLTPHDVWWRSRRQPDLACSALGEVVRDLHPGAAGAHHEHELVREWLGVPVFAGVRQLALEHVAPGPIGDGRLRLVPGGDHHLGNADLAGGGEQQPAAVRALDPL